MAFNFKLLMSNNYLVDTRSHIYIAVNKDQFVVFKTNGRQVSGITEDHLDVKGIGETKLVHPSTGQGVVLNVVR